MPKTTLPRVVIDTNLFVSGLILKRGHPYALLQAWRNRAFLLLLSDALETEIAEVLLRPHIQEKYHLTIDEIEEVLGLLETEAKLCTPASVLSVTLRDPKDEKIYALALAGKADYLITGDNDLLTLKTFAFGEILTVADFLKRLKQIQEQAA